MICLDANILIRAILGRRVRHLIDTYGALGVRFIAPEVAFDDSLKYLPALLKKRGKSQIDLPGSLQYLRQTIEPISSEPYREFEGRARELLRGRDEDDWAHFGHCARTRVCSLDRGSGFLRYRRGCLDHKSN